MRCSEETRKEYIYLLQEREFVRSNEQTYKIGRTKSLQNRLSAYPKDSVLIMLCDVKNSVHAEQKIMSCFKEQFVQQRQYGIEYFLGDVNKMKIVMSETLHKLDKPLPNLPSVSGESPPQKPLPELPKDNPPQKPLPELPPQKSLPTPPLEEDQKVLHKTLKKREKTSFVCPKCSKKMASKQTLQNHLDRAKPCVLMCCGHLYGSSKTYKNHRRNKHSVSEEVHKTQNVATRELEMQKLHLREKEIDMEIRANELKAQTKEKELNARVRVKELELAQLLKCKFTI